VRAVLCVPLDERPAVAERPALPKPGIERLEPLGGLTDEQHERDVAELRFDVKADLGLVGHPRGWIDFVLRHPPLQRRADGRLRPRDLERIGIGQQPRPDLLGFPVGRALRAFALTLDVDALDEDDPLAVDGSSPADTRTSKQRARRRMLPRWKLARFVDRFVDGDQLRGPEKIKPLPSLLVRTCASLVRPKGFEPLTF
jgi:hypothetical protein